MRFAIFGLTVSASWGNGHATLWRGLIRALVNQGCRVTFFERDQPFYAEHRDLDALEDAELVLYPEWDAVRARARSAIAEADVAMVTSYCPDGRAACALVLDAGRGWKIFYDLDSPVTLARLEAGDDVPYLPKAGLSDFDLALSYAGGRAIEAMKRQLGAKRVVPLYGHADPARHRPGAPRQAFEGGFSYIGTYASDRQATLDSLFLEPARRLPDQIFVLAGAGYPEFFPWSKNIHFVRHLPPADHPDFFSSSRATLNVTRQDMARYGFCPSGRLFEAAACGAALVSDDWEGIETFFASNEEILIARSSDDVVDFLGLPSEEMARIARRGRERVLDCHTSAHRARDLLETLRVSAPAEKAAV